MIINENKEEEKKRELIMPLEEGILIFDLYIWLYRSAEIFLG
jgi:hypothetical protein